MSETGDTLDYAREAAAEAGFFDHKYGTPEEAVARSTVADLLDAVEEEIRSGPAAARFATAQDEAALSRLESAVHEIARLGGPALDDRLLERAARLTLDGADPFDALERVLVSDELAGLSAPVTYKQIIEGLATDMNYVGKHVSVPGSLVKHPGLKREGPGPVKGTWYAFERTSPGDLPPAVLVDMSPEEKAALPRAAASIFLVREADDAIIGTIKSSKVRRTSVRRIEHVVVSPELQRQGIATWMLDRLLEENPNIDLSSSVDGVFSPAGLAFLQRYNDRLARPDAAGERTGEPLPGWSDEELIAASENRGSVPEPDGLDEPGRIEPDDTDLRELAALPEDALIPTEDGLVSASELLAGIARQENLLRVTQACRA